MDEDRIVIRDGLVADGDAVREIVIPIIDSFGISIEPETLDPEILQFGEPLPQVKRELVACLNGVVVGCAVITIEDSATLKLCALYVSPKYQGRGIGRLLITEVIAYSKSVGASGIYLETWERFLAAVHLYESFGWVRTGPLPPESGSEWAYYLSLEAESRHAPSYEQLSGAHP